MTDGIHLIPCCTTGLAPGGFEEKDEQKTGRLTERIIQKMDNHPVHTTPNHWPPKINFLPELLSNNPCCELASAALKYVPQTAATTFAFSSVCFFFYCGATVSGMEDTNYAKNNS